MTMHYINLSGYKFHELDDLTNLRESLRSFCRSLGLKGTILLSEEGINAFVSGTRDIIDTFKASLTDFGLPPMEFKESPSTNAPFTRMLVKIKSEIIAMGQPQIKPSRAPAPYVSAKTFKEWIESGKDMIILDTRNDYEWHLGKFKNAVTLDIDHFRAFPDAVSAFPEEWKEKTIVTFCTGGIRCEKAAPFMIAMGFKNVYQLEGGILKYFEECRKDHYEGECFVFDKRVAVNDALEETTTVQCFRCRMPVIPELQSSEKYKINEYCPSCYDRRAHSS